VISIPAEQAEELNKLVERSMVIHINIQDEEAYVSSDKGQVTITPEIWRGNS
jgi:uncharacterized protein YaeQ